MTLEFLWEVDKLSSLLIDEHPLVVLPSLAKEIGLNEAIMMQQIHFWINKRKHFKDGKYWVYNTYDGWADQSESGDVRIPSRRTCRSCL